MIEQLEQLCFAVGAIRDTDAEKVVSTVNQKVAELLGAHIVKLFWRQEAERGGVILRPVSYVNVSQASDPQQFAVGPDAEGVLEWVFAHGEPLWLEDIRHQDRDGTIRNQCTRAEIEMRQLAFSDPPQSDAMIVVPIRERGVVVGLYAVELPSTRGLSKRVVTLMERLARAMGTMLYNSDVFQYDMTKSGRAISQFVTSMQTFTFDRVMLTQNVRTAFVARPYDTAFLPIQKALERTLRAEGIRARHYEAENRQYIINEIIDQIRNSHFCVADITGNNLNVVAEIAVMTVLGKKPLVLKRKGDAAKLPFDLSQYSYWEYELGEADGELRVHRPAAHDFVPLLEVLRDFVGELPADSGYFMAQEWRPDAAPDDGGDAPAQAGAAASLPV
jgi:GAF domain-containing protein